MNLRAVRGPGSGPRAARRYGALDEQTIDGRVNGARRSSGRTGGSRWWAVAAMLPAGEALAAPSQEDCDRRNNNTYQKILECVRLDQVRAHQAALQEIADENG